MVSKKTGSRKGRTLRGRKALRKPAVRKTAARKSPAREARAVERVVAELAHDIRTPLTGIIALSELLAGANLSPRERQWVAALRNSADHLASLTTLIVDAARHSARDVPLRHESFDLRAFVDAVVFSIVTRAQGAGLQCRTEIDPALPVTAVGDAVRLRAALENLIDNAVKFTLRGSVDLKVAAKSRGKATELTFEITDTGIGLSPAEIKRLFKPFAQAHGGIARRFGGTGLGLSLVKRLANAMNGDLGVTSTPGRGSTFRLTVTLAT
jgi:signal transduction histidine kinase